MLKKNKSCWLVPEVVQSSNMDCGPASLKSILQGFGIDVSYGRLREACQTDVDGTSIDTLEDIARQLGLDAEQIMIPADHLFINDTCVSPALFVVKLPNGCTHFVVAWGKTLNKIQLMDPATGRRWTSEQQFIDELYIHSMPVLANDWREWAGSSDFLEPLNIRIKALGAAQHEVNKLIMQACSDKGWMSLGFLDAATRMLNTLLLTNGIDKGQSSVRLLISLCEQFHSSKVMDLVPARYWIVQPDSEEKKQIIYSGAVLVKINGCLANNEKCLPESPDLRNAILEKEQKPFKVLLEILDNNFYFYVFVLSAILLSSLMVLFESILFRGLIDIQSQLKSIDQRIAAVLLTCVFLLFLIIVEYPIIKTLFGLGRNLENKFRILFLQKLPRINDRYFQSRPRSDMAERSHQLYTLRQLPNLIGQLLQNIFHLLATMVGILYLVTDLTIWLLLMVVVLTVVPFIFRPFVTERDLRVKTHVGALSHFYLDALQGLMPIKASCAEKTIRQEHEKLQLEWASANLALLRLNVTSQTIQVIISTIFIIAMVIVTAEQKEYQLYLLLLVYWLMRIPQYTDAMAQSIRKLSSYRNVSLRAIEPLGALEDKDQSIDTAFGEQANTITFDNVSVKMSGHYLLNDINLCIDAGEHIAIVGRSGAGKSSLAGLLLGWLKPLKGRVLLNKRELLGSVQKKFCQNTAWVDPSIQLWNTSVLNNLNYGVKNDNLKAGILEPSLLQRAELMSLISKLSNGLQTNIGEGGSLVSGGEGQRIRLGRGMAKSEATFTILDEPFSGLEREKRQDLLSSCRKLWKKSTLLFISHDISETLQFPRVIVIDGGRIVEDSSPKLLAADPKSQYSQLLQAEKSVQDDCWHNKYWRRVSVTDGKLVEDKHE